ncbi:hypothetical protein JCM10212_000725 [Sporobolomyces blumeae]
MPPRSDPAPATTLDNQGYAALDRMTLVRDLEELLKCAGNARVASILRSNVERLFTRQTWPLLSPERQHAVGSLVDWLHRHLTSIDEFLSIVRPEKSVIALPLEVVASSVERVKQGVQGETRRNGWAKTFMGDQFFVRWSQRTNAEQWAFYETFRRAVETARETAGRTGIFAAPEIKDVVRRFEEWQRSASRVPSNSDRPDSAFGDGLLPAGHWHSGLPPAHTHGGSHIMVQPMSFPSVPPTQMPHGYQAVPPMAFHTPALDSMLNPNLVYHPTHGFYPHTSSSQGSFVGDLGHQHGYFPPSSEYSVRLIAVEAYG